MGGKREETDLVADLLSKPFSRGTFQEKDGHGEEKWRSPEASKLMN